MLSSHLRSEITLLPFDKYAQQSLKLHKLKRNISFDGGQDVLLFYIIIIIAVCPYNLNGLKVFMHIAHSFQRARTIHLRCNCR